MIQKTHKKKEVSKEKSPINSKYGLTIEVYSNDDDDDDYVYFLSILVY